MDVQLAHRLDGVPKEGGKNIRWNFSFLTEQKSRRCNFIFLKFEGISPLGLVHKTAKTLYKQCRVLYLHVLAIQDLLCLTLEEKLIHSRREKETFDSI